MQWKSKCTTQKRTLPLAKTSSRRRQPGTIASCLLSKTAKNPIVFAASGGLYSYGAGTQVLYRFDPQWEARTFIEYERLTGSAADSPLVTQRGSANQLTYGVGATYSFNMHPWW